MYPLVPVRTAATLKENMFFPHLKPIKRVTLKAKSAKGKQRLRQHGHEFDLIQEKPDKKLYRSVQDPNYIRWVDNYNDPDIEVL